MVHSQNIHVPGAGEGMVISDVSRGTERERKCTRGLTSWGVMDITGPQLVMDLQVF